MRRLGGSSPLPAARRPLPASEAPPRPGRAWTWTRRALAGFGVVVLASILVRGLTDAGEPPPVSWALVAPEVRTQDVLLALSGATNAPVRSGGSAELLVNGDEFVPALLAEIDGARDSIHFMTYVWESGELSRRLFDALVARAREGVVVRLLLDAHGGRGAPQDRIAELEEAGGRVAVYRPLGPGSLLGWNARNHRRAMVFDGRVAFTGGMGVADTWLGDGGDPEHWRDDLTRATGPLARSLQAAFAQLWTEATGEILGGPAVYPLDPPSDASGDPIRVHVSVVSSPSGKDRPLAKTWWISFAGARERIWITTPYFVPGPRVRDALAERARAGVDVRVLTAGEHVDLRLVRYAARHFYAPLLEAGVRIFEYQPTLVHSKLAVVDGIWSLVGSPNLDVRSEEINQENLLAILDASFAAELEATFERDLSRSVEIDPAAWRRRGLLARLRQQAAALLREQL